MWRSFVVLLIYILGYLATYSNASDDTLFRVRVHDKELIGYQAKPLLNPKGGNQFNGSNFIHPLRSPSGFVVTEIQPSDHLHHFGLWWPWKYLEVEGRKVLCWELQDGEGLVQAQKSNPTAEGFTAKSIYIDRKAPGGPQILINETLNVRISKIIDSPVMGYNLDLEIIHEIALDKPITILKYRYSGFAFRGTSIWDKDNSSVLTSEGKYYDASNFTRAKWVRVEGSTEEGHTAGVLLMSCPRNHDHPELLRTWNNETHNGAIFINFNSVQNASWIFEPGEKYTRRFRVFVYDGALSTEQAETMWGLFIRTTESTLSSEGEPSEEM